MAHVITGQDAAQAGGHHADGADRSAMVVGAALNTVGPLGVWTMPLIIGMFSHRFGLTNTGAGVLASTALAGACGMAFLQALLFRVLPQRRVGAICLSLLLLAYLSLLGSFGFAAALATMLVLGLGMGGLLVVGMTAAARSGQITRVSAFGLVGQAGFAALISWSVSQFDGRQADICLALALAATTMLGFAVLRRVPVEAIAPPAHAAASARPSRAMMLALAAWGLANFASGGFWPLTERVGTLGGLSSADVGEAVSLSSLAGIAGAAAAILIGRALGTTLPIVAIGLGTMASLMGIVLQSSATTFAASMLLFGLLWNFGPPYQLPVIADVDEAGNGMAWSILVLKASMAAGPVIYGPIADRFGFPAAGLVATAAAALSTLLFCFVAFRGASARRPTPDLTRSSSLDR